MKQSVFFRSISRVLFTTVAFLAMIQFSYAQTPQFEEVTVTAQRFALERINWDGSSHQEGGVTRVGAYPRKDSANTYDYETLVKFDLSSIQGSIIDAKLRFRVIGGNLGTIKTVTLYRQHLKRWSPDTVNYDHFCGSLQIGQEYCFSWHQRIASTEVTTNPDWYELSDVALTNMANNWKNDPSFNWGAVLAGAFYDWQYFVEIDDVELVLTVKK